MDKTKCCQYEWSVAHPCWLVFHRQTGEICVLISRRSFACTHCTRCTRTLMEKTFLKNLEEKAVSPTLCLQPIRRLLQPDESLIEEHRREGGWFSYFLMSFWGGVQQQVWKRCCLALKLQPSTPPRSLLSVSVVSSWQADGERKTSQDPPLCWAARPQPAANPETFAANHVVHFQIQVSKPCKQTQRRSNLAPLASLSAALCFFGLHFARVNADGASEAESM